MNKKLVFSLVLLLSTMNFQIYSMEGPEGNPQIENNKELGKIVQEAKQKRVQGESTIDIDAADIFSSDSDDGENQGETTKKRKGKEKKYVQQLGDHPSNPIYTHKQGMGESKNNPTHQKVNLNDTALKIIHHNNERNPLTHVNQLVGAGESSSDPFYIKNVRKKPTLFQRYIRNPFERGITSGIQNSVAAGTQNVIQYCVSCAKRLINPAQALFEKTTKDIEKLEELKEKATDEKTKGVLNQAIGQIHETRKVAIFATMVRVMKQYKK